MSCIDLISKSLVYPNFCLFGMQSPAVLYHVVPCVLHATRCQELFRKLLEKSLPCSVVLYVNSCAGPSWCFHQLTFSPLHSVPPIDFTISEEETHLQNAECSTNTLPPTNHPQTPSSSESYQPTPSELLFGQQDKQQQTTTLTIIHSSPPNPFTGQPLRAPTATLGMTPSGGYVRSIHADVCMLACVLPCL